MKKRIGVVSEYRRDFIMYCKENNITPIKPNLFKDAKGDEFIPILRIDHIRGANFDEVIHVNGSLDLYYHAKNRIK